MLMSFLLSCVVGWEDSHPGVVELEKAETTSIEVICTRYTIPCLYASTSTQWFIDILFITRDSRMSNKLCGRKTTKQKELDMLPLK